MSLKSIEMQVALPRTVDAAKLSEQLQQRGQIISSQANEEMNKKIERDRHSVNTTKQKDEAFVKDDHPERNGQSDQNFQRKKQKQQGPKQETHPYKGKTIDFSG